MNLSQRTLRILVPLLIIAPLHAAAQQPAPVQPVPVQPVPVQAPATQPAPSLVLTPRYAQPDDPWIYRGTDIPVDREWLFGEMPNGVRYAVRRNSVPPGQVSMRVRIDAGSLHEEESERGFAHLVEHLVFRESKYFG